MFLENCTQKKKEKSPKPIGLGLNIHGGDKRDRTADLLNAIQALSQLSYTPTVNVLTNTGNYTD